MRIGFYTLGCKVNQYETEAMKEKFIAAGHEIVGSLGEDDSLLVPADAYVINTCTVTNMADRKSRQFIRRAKKLNPDSIIAVVGCYAQVDPDAVSKIEGVDIILGTNEKIKIFEVLEKEFSARSDGSAAPFIDIIPRDELSEYMSDGIIKAMESRTRAYIKIQEGCDRFCSYCIIPIARGPVRSRSEDEIIEEARGLVAAGFKEIVLTGINTALYGLERVASASEGTSVDAIAGASTSTALPPLRILLDKLAGIPGDFRIRLSSLEPNVMKAEDVLAIVGAEKLCHHLHLSIQSGSNNILKAMNRRYTREEYLDIVCALKDFDPYFAITTDIIVGFPGETEEDFRDSIELVKFAGLSKVHVFPYSARKGTVAAEMENQIDSEEKKRRAKILSDVAEEVAANFHDECLGKTVTGLFEEIHDEYMTGYTDNYIRIYAEKEESLLNELVSVELVELHKDGGLARPVI